MLNETEIETYPFPQLRERFTSGNDIPVPRARLLRKEYENILSTVRELQRQNVELRAELDGDDLPLRDKLETAEGLIASQLERMEELQRQVAERDALINDIRDWDTNKAYDWLAATGEVRMTLPLEIRKRMVALNTETTG